VVNGKTKTEATRNHTQVLISKLLPQRSQRKKKAGVRECRGAGEKRQISDCGDAEETRKESYQFSGKATVGFQSLSLDEGRG